MHEILMFCVNTSRPLLYKIKTNKILLSSQSHPPTTNSVCSNPPFIDVRAFGLVLSIRSDLNIQNKGIYTVPFDCC